MNRNLENQPYTSHEDTQKTRLLPVSSSGATPQPAVAAPPLAQPGQEAPLADHRRRTRPTTWVILQHLLALILLGGLFVLSLYFFTQTAIGQQLDEDSFNEFSYQFLRIQTQTTSLLNLIPATAGILALVGLLFVLIWKHRFVPAVIGLLVALCANGSTQLIKHFLLTKPDYGVQEALMNSAPSGHTAFAAGAGAALFLASPKKLRPTVAVLGALFALAAGFSTMVNAWHRPVDVVSAILLTTFWTVLGLGVLRFMRSEELDMSNTRYSGLILVPLLSIAGFFLGFCTVALYAVTYFDPIPGGALLAATCMILSVTAFTTSLQIALLRPQNKVRSAYTKIWTY
ncbi:phosphatase PAP2 family protein [Rothia aerolata]|uniref:Phosphatidic acid phosphatase type 2/haloperoxidase domain-containing protein n=1 Tax=Rothia aerolata TaxID=1812262 RepID=A0A917IR98_9MICC|nr:phosphatase PAP2 family protein [Rothia aerolata]GGH60978.1 hypothetical protein GCM10007359_09710 [Rothia aerolata]